jgi:hypothetical protein
MPETSEELVQKLVVSFIYYSCDAFGAYISSCRVLGANFRENDYEIYIHYCIHVV